MTTTKTNTSARARIRAAFTALRANDNIYARANFMCCQNCGCTAIAEKNQQREKGERYAGYVFYHRQDADALDREGNVRAGETLYLSFGGFADDAATLRVGKRVLETLRDMGLHAAWNGTAGRRIAVLNVKER